MEAIQDQITDIQIKIIKQSTCPSLSGRSKLCGLLPGIDKGPGRKPVGP